MADDALYLQMLKQMGLQPQQVPADMRETIYQKLNLALPNAKPSKVAKEKREKQKTQLQ